MAERAIRAAAQRPDGGFAGRQGDSDLYYTGFAVRSLALLGELQGVAADRVAAFLRTRLATTASVIDLVSLLYAAALLRTAAGIDVWADADPAANTTTKQTGRASRPQTIRARCVWAKIPVSNSLIKSKAQTSCGRQRATRSRRLWELNRDT